MPKILQTITTLHILTAICISEARIDILFTPYLQKNIEIL